MPIDGGKKRKVKKVKKSKTTTNSGTKHHTHTHTHEHKRDSNLVFDATNKDGDEYTYIPYKQFLPLDKALEKMKKSTFTKTKATKLDFGTPLLLCFNKDDGSTSNYQIAFYIGYDKANDAIYTSRVPPLMTMALFYSVLPNQRGNVSIQSTAIDKICAEKSYILNM